MIKKAIISVSDKTGVEELAPFLHQRGVALISSGGTYNVLKSARIPVTQVSDVTGFPEILDGRVKTLHPIIFSGILAKRDKEHLDQFYVKLSRLRPIHPNNLSFRQYWVHNILPFVPEFAL